MPYTREQLSKMSTEELRKLAPKATPVEVAETPELAGLSPQKARELLQKLPTDRLRVLHDEVAEARKSGKLDPKDQFGGVFRSILSRLTGGEMTEEGVDPGASEKVVSALNALDTTQRNPNPPSGSIMERVSGAIENFKTRYGQEKERGKELIGKVGARRAVETPVRSVLEPTTMGASEPVISGIKAGLKAGVQGDFSMDNLVKNFRADVSQREGDQAVLPAVDMSAQVPGMIIGPTGLARKGLTKLAAKSAMGKKALDAGAALLRTEEGAGLPTRIAKSAARIAVAGGKSAVDLAENQAVRKATLEAPGFSREEPSVGDAARFGGKIGAAVQAVPEAMGAAGQTGRFMMSVFLGPGKRHLDYYWKNMERLRGKEADIGQLSDALTEAVDKIRNDFQTAQLSEAEAKEALKGLEKSVRWARGREAGELGEMLTMAKQDLDLAMKQRKYELGAFKKAMPQQLLADVEDSVKQVRKGVVDAHVDKLSHLQKSPAVVDISDLDGFFDKAAADLSVGADDRVIGEQAQAMMANLRKYQGELQELAASNGGQLPAKDTWKVIKQMGEDVDWMRDQPGFKGKFDSTISQVYGELSKRLSAAVEGYGEKMSAQNKAGHLLDQAKTYFSTPEKIVATLSRVNDPETGFLARRALLDIGEATGKDFKGILDAVDEASRVSQEPMAQHAARLASPEGQRVQGLQEQLKLFKDPETLETGIQAELAGSPQASALAQATEARQATEELDKLFRGFSEMTMESKIKSVMRGHEAMKGRMKMLSQLSDEDFVQAISDLENLTAMGKAQINGSRNVNFFTSLGYAGASNADPAKRTFITMLASSFGYLRDLYGPAMSRKILDGFGSMKGLITAAKIGEMDLPANVRQDMVSQFAKSLYLGTQVDHDPVVAVGPEEMMLIRREIKQSNLSNTEKARAISGLNGKQKATGLRKLLIGDTPVPAEEPVEAPPADYDSVMQQMSSARR